MKKKTVVFLCSPKTNELYIDISPVTFLFSEIELTV